MMIVDSGLIFGLPCIPGEFIRQGVRSPLYICSFRHIPFPQSFSSHNRRQYICCHNF